MADPNQDNTAGVGPVVQKWGPWVLAVIISIAISVIQQKPWVPPPMPMQPAPVIVNCPYPATVATPAAK